MRLSEAIRLGAMLNPQGFVSYFSGDTTCSIGAALRAVNKEHGSAFDEWPWLLETVNGVRITICPSCGSGHLGPWSVITHLNDEHRWTRESVADWVATVEPPETPQETARSTDAVSAVLDSTDVPVAVYARQGI